MGHTGLVVLFLLVNIVFLGVIYSGGRWLWWIVCVEVANDGVLKVRLQVARSW